MPKSRFREIQVQLERYVLEAMPELKQRAVIAREHERDAAQEEALQNTPEGVLAGDSVAERVARALSHSADRASLRRRLEAEGLELYIRGQTPGVIEHHSGKKHRLKTLGLALWNAFEALPEEQLSQMVEMSEFAGENEKGAVNEALQDTERHQAPEPERTDTQALWEAELKELRARHEQERQSEAGKSTALLRELKALVRFAVSDTLRGIRSRALKMLERLNIKPKHYEHERRRRDPQHQRGR